MRTHIEYLESTINKINLKEKEIWFKNAQLIALRSDLLIELFTEITDIHAGDDVVLINGNKGVVIDIREFCGSALPKIRLYKKDGHLGKIKKEIYKWETELSKFEEELT